MTCHVYAWTTVTITTTCRVSKEEKLYELERLLTNEGQTTQLFIHSFAG